MEQYCKENGLTNLLDSVDDTKADLKLPPITSPRLNSLEEAKQMSILSRDLHASLEDVHSFFISSYLILPYHHLDQREVDSYQKDGNKGEKDCRSALA